MAMRSNALSMALCSSSVCEDSDPLGVASLASPKAPGKKLQTVSFH